MLQFRFCCYSDRGLIIFFLCERCGKSEDHPIKIFRLSALDSGVGRDCTLEICGKLVTENSAALIAEELKKVREEFYQLFKKFLPQIEACQRIERRP